MEKSRHLVDEWLQLALLEYEQIAALSNVQSLLGNAAAELSSSQMMIDGGDDFDVCNQYDPNILIAQMKHRSVEDLLASYNDRIDDVRKTHASLKSKAAAMSSMEVDADAKIKSRLTPLDLALNNHIELSERVICTIMRSPSPGCAGPCGLFYENGLVRPSNVNDYENNVVALAALRASVSKLKMNFGGER
ncbi:hypothetical protein ACHAWO_003108 [Cyclotella atomus]|jgi:hypothetical protein|uniref:Uncharacterized protein n=1 Tax=Cyclotella atomus TaxID=382360 RepID=A0ABD3NLF5_9STRA